VYTLVFDLLLLRAAYTIMIETRDIAKYLPFLLFGIIFAVNESFVLLSIYNNVAWLALEIAILISFVWILINLRRCHK
jgi:hypothetical protein